MCIRDSRQTVQMRYLGSLVTSPAQKRWSQICRTVEGCTQRSRNCLRVAAKAVCEALLLPCYQAERAELSANQEVWDQPGALTRAHPDIQAPWCPVQVCTVWSLHLALPPTWIGRACAYLPTKGYINIPWNPWPANLMTHKGWKEKDLFKVKDKVATRASLYKLDSCI